MATYSEEELRAVVDRYQAARAAALAERDAGLRAFEAAGWRPVELQRVTGYSRETIRQALQPQAREIVNEARRRAVALRSRGRYFVVPNTMDGFHGPTDGTVTPPDRFEAGTPVDFANPSEVAHMYWSVLYHAESVDDLNEWLDPQLLVKAWPLVVARLHTGLRDRWEHNFASLRESARAGWPARRSSTWY